MLVFLCSSLEPGKNGVGDYTRILAATLSQELGPARIIALNDTMINQAREENQKINDHNIHVLRLPTSMAWSKRIDKASNYLGETDPEWISLQFVPYGFHAKGIIGSLAKRLEPLTRGRKIHLMMHEIWIGESKEYNFKDRIVGLVQKNFVLQLIKSLKPIIIHTSNPAFRFLLQRNGVVAQELPLFGSIPVETPVEINPVLKELSNRSHPIDKDTRKIFLLIGIFGTLHPQWQPEPLFTQLKIAAEKLGRKIIFLAAGRLGSAGENIWKNLTKKYSNSFTLINFATQPKRFLSHYLQTLDLGVATSPWALIGKSSTVAAMLDHGLPVVVTRNDWHLRSGITPDPHPHPLLHIMDSGFASRLIQGLPRQAPKSRLPIVADELLKSFTNCDGALPLN